ncbi:MAG: fasciclin domain-containing protein [Myxococcales bacterium]|nr:fasciclin domain-containing protein [Myxococcales bacterium]
MSLLETAKAAGNFTTLLAAVEAAGLQDTLNGAGPFTVFAPTDEAFAKLPKKDLEALLKDKTKLAGILTYHVVAGNQMAADVGAAKELVTVQGASVAVDTSAGVKVGGASVTATDIAASNGTIHVIDTVMMPPKATKKKK